MYISKKLGASYAFIQRYYTLFYIRTSILDPRLAVLKIFMIFRDYCSQFVFFPNFFRRKVKLDFPMYSKHTNLEGACSWNKMWSLKGLAMLKCEIKTSLHAAQCKWQPGSVLMFCSYYFKNCQPRHFVLMFCGTTIVALFLTCSWIICQNQGFCWCKIVLIKKECIFL